MKNCELYEMLELPEEVIVKLNSYEKERTINISVELQNKILCRELWDEGIKELQSILEEDSDGFKILWELLNIVSNYSYEKYLCKNIPQDIFIETMKICTRFLNEHYKTYGTYKFVWAWWLPREISLCEYRIGALEYEFVDGENREISMHIPSDADLKKESVLQSLNDFYCFRDTYFPEWKNVRMVCDSWMLAPALEELLSESSNVLSFKRMFEIEHANEDAMWFMGFIYPGYGVVDENLPETTSLQRKMKKHLLEGKKVGVAKGYLKDF